MEQKKHQEAIDLIDEGITKAKEGGMVEYVKLAKALQRKGNAYCKLELYDQAIEQYNKALVENNDHGIKMSLQGALKLQKEKADREYINPEIAEAHRNKGNDFFKEGKYPDAIKEYNEGLRRAPNTVAILSNRAAAYIKLMEFNTALKDADKCIELDPKFVKAYARKGNCHHMMKEYHKAMKAYEDGLKLDATNKDCLEGKNRTLSTIQMSAQASSGNDEERLQHAMADPEIQRIMKDPLIIQTLRDL